MSSTRSTIDRGHPIAVAAAQMQALLGELTEASSGEAGEGLRRVRRADVFGGRGAEKFTWAPRPCAATRRHGASAARMTSSSASSGDEGGGDDHRLGVAVGEGRGRGRHPGDGTAEGAEAQHRCGCLGRGVGDRGHDVVAELGHQHVTWHHPDARWPLCVLENAGVRPCRDLLVGDGADRQQWVGRGSGGLRLVVGVAALVAARTD
ncbi:MAG: hypothetical protein M3237_08985 [Actinomycetota bacterium]|nr:hypothetical protein [Actinomycetota bacterium]